MVNDIIFLGAGASKAEGAPLQADLFRKYFKVCKPNAESSKREQTLYGRIRKFLKDFFGIDTNRDNLGAVFFPTFEEVLGVLEMAIRSNTVSK